MLTLTALGAGSSFTASTGAHVVVTELTSDGFAVNVDDPASVLVEVPDLFEDSPGIAAHRLQSLGLVPKFYGTNTATSWVASQSPLAGHQVAKGTIVSMNLKTGPRP